MTDNIFGGPRFGGKTLGHMSFHLKRIDPALAKAFQDAVMGNLVDVCAVSSLEGENCPEEPRHIITLENGTELSLCDDCFRNYQNGAYGDIDSP